MDSTMLKRENFHYDLGRKDEEHRHECQRLLPGVLAQGIVMVEYDVLNPNRRMRTRRNLGGSDNKFSLGHIEFEMLL